LKCKGATFGLRLSIRRYSTQSRRPRPAPASPCIDGVALIGPPAGRTLPFLVSGGITLGSQFATVRDRTSAPDPGGSDRSPDPPWQTRERETPATTPHAGLLAHPTSQRKARLDFEAGLELPRARFIKERAACAI
jgi:hypothetical protein